MRDVSHQARGAHLLGLENHTKNMLLRFAQSIAESRDFCCFWEIDRNYRPCPVDYTSDDDFWYNLPRRDYPELSYAVIGDYIYDLMGIRYDLKTKSITVHPNLPDGVTYAAVRNLPVYGQEADVVIENGISSITLH